MVESHVGSGGMSPRRHHDQLMLKPGGCSCIMLDSMVCLLGMHFGVRFPDRLCGGSQRASSRHDCRELEVSSDLLFGL